MHNGSFRFTDNILLNTNYSLLQAVAFSNNGSKVTYQADWSNANSQNISSSLYRRKVLLTHWGRVTHKCINKLTIVQIMTCHMVDTKPSSGPILEYIEIHTRKLIWNCRLENVLIEGKNPPNLNINNDKNQSILLLRWLPVKQAYWSTDQILSCSCD